MCCFSGISILIIWCSVCHLVLISISQMREYHAKHPTTDTLPNPKPTQPCAFMMLALWYGLANMQITPSAEDSGQKSVEEEFTSYTATISHSNADVLMFWEVGSYWHPNTFVISISTYITQLERPRYPTVFRMAMDYLPIQASSVPCEHVFSSSAETDTKKCNCISPMLMEMLKFWLKKDRLHFTWQWITPQKDMLHDEDTEDSLSHLVAAEGNLNNAMVQAIDAITSSEGDTLQEHIQLFQIWLPTSLHRLGTWKLVLQGRIE